MLETCRDLDLAQEPVGTERGGELGAEDLHRHLPAVADILGQVDRGHPSLSDLSVEGVTVLQSFGQAGEGARAVQRAPGMGREEPEAIEVRPPRKGRGRGSRW